MGDGGKGGAGTRSGRRASVLDNPQVARLVGTNLLAIVCEWASVIAVLVYAYDQGGSTATGLSSLALLSPVLLGAPLSAFFIDRFPAQVVRRLGLLVQVLGYVAAAAAAGADAPVAVVVVFGFVSLAALCTLRPTAAILLPAVVRSSGELTTGTLWGSYAECASALVGPLVAAALLATGGPTAALAGCAAFVGAALLLSLAGRAPDPPAEHDAEAWNEGTVLAGAKAAVQDRPFTAGLLLVVLALGPLDLGDGGAGLLGALVGLGAVVSALVATAVVRRRVLAPWLAVGLGVAAACCLLLGFETELAVAVVVLPIIGVAVALLFNLSRMLLQRSADPRRLGSLFSLVELVGGLGLLVGSGLAQLLLYVGDEQLALTGVAVLLLVVLAATGRAVWQADAGADVPVVEMSVLQELPMFAPLPPLELEVVARSAEHVRVPAGEVVVAQGEPGDRFYAVAEGGFDVVMSGEHIRTARRGSFFGEVALLADVPRTATVTAEEDGELLAVERVPFLFAVTGSDTSKAAAWGVVRSLRLDTPLPAAETEDEDEPAAT